MSLGVGQPRTVILKSAKEGNSERYTVVLALSSSRREVSGDTVYGLDLIALQNHCKSAMVVSAQARVPALLTSGFYF